MWTVKVARRRFYFLFLAGGLAAGAAARVSLEPSPSEVLQMATDAVAKQRGGAEHLVRRVLSRDGNSTEAWWLLGVLYAARDDSVGALACFRRIPPSHPNWFRARFAEGDQLFRLGDVVAAEAAWRETSKDPSFSLDADRRLLALYGLQLRRSEWGEALWRIVNAGQTSLREMVHLVIMGHVVWQGEGVVETLSRFVAANPEDAATRASLIQHLLASGRSGEAKEQLETLTRHPTQTHLDGRAVMAYAVAEADPQVVDSYVASASEERRERLRQDAAWLRGLGELQLLRGDATKAIPHLEAAARKDPFHPGGRQQLSLALRLAGRSDEAQLHAAAAEVLARLDRTCHAMLSAGAWTAQDALTVVRDAASVGMIEEAKAWAAFLQKENPADDAARTLLAKLERESLTGRRRPPAAFVDPRREARR